MGDTKKSEPDRMFGEELIWLFIIGDMCIFSMFFWVYGSVRIDELDLFRAAQENLNIHYGSINTLLLLASSWLVVIAQKSLHQDEPRQSSRFIAMAGLLGTVFACLKILEYMHKAELGIDLETNNFFLFYYLLTGLHLAHLITGIALLFYFSLILRSSVVTSTQIKTFESTAIFWHMVDLLWIIIFPLLYLLD
ncbi:MAG: cytochrome c oxidase subunit 3 [Parvibaculaceae bacterium]